MDEEQNNLTKYERWELRKEEKETEAKRRMRGRLIKRAALWTSVLAVLVLAALGTAKLAATPPGEGLLLANVVSVSDWVKGNPAAKTILIEYSDFQCPACAAYFPLVKKLNEELGSKIEFVYRHFPLTQHANAKPAAYAAEAAGKQGKFWEMHDKLFGNQTEWAETGNAEAIFSGYAATIGLDVERFTRDMHSDEIKAKVEGDLQSGLASRVDHTPTFFLNGSEIPNPKTYEEFRGLILKAVPSAS